MPERIQLRRTKGWRKPEGAVVVARPSKWGNPVRWWPSKPVLGAEDITGCSPERARALSVQGFRDVLADPLVRAAEGYPGDVEIRAELAGRDLACWCPLDQPCHADVLLEIANGVGA